MKCPECGSANVVDIDDFFTQCNDCQKIYHYAYSKKQINRALTYYQRRNDKREARRRKEMTDRALNAF